MFLRVSIYACHAFGDARCDYSRDACVLARVFDAVRCLSDLLHRGRLLEIRFVLYRIFRVSVARVSRSYVRYSVYGICSLGFRAFRRLATRIRAYDQYYRDPFIFDRSELRAFYVLLFGQAIRGHV